MSILHRRRRVAERKEQPAESYTREQLEAMSAADVQGIYEGMGGTHQNKAASIKAILSA